MKRFSTMLAAALVPMGTGLGALSINSDAALHDFQSNLSVHVSPGVSALFVTESALPAFPVPHYKTVGTYPQVSRQDAVLVKVDAALRKAVLDDQHQYSASARREVARLPTYDRSQTNLGLYEWSPVASLISASTAVVSALIPTREVYPLGNDGDAWVALTFAVPSGSQVDITDLFANWSSTLKALATSAQTSILHGHSETDKCVQQYETIEGVLPRESYDSGFEPMSSNYQYLALVPGGVAVGFPQGQLSEEACGRVEATVPYPVVEPFLNAHGKRLIAAVRHPHVSE